VKDLPFPADSHQWLQPHDKYNEPFLSTWLAQWRCNKAPEPLMEECWINVVRPLMKGGRLPVCTLPEVALAFAARPCASHSRLPCAREVLTQIGDYMCQQLATADGKGHQQQGELDLTLHMKLLQTYAQLNVEHQELIRLFRSSIEACSHRSLSHLTPRVVLGYARALLKLTPPPDDSPPSPMQMYIEDDEGYRGNLEDPTLTRLLTTLLHRYESLNNHDVGVLCNVLRQATHPAPLMSRYPTYELVLQGVLRQLPGRIPTFNAIEVGVTSNTLSHFHLFLPDAMDQLAHRLLSLGPAHRPSTHNHVLLISSLARLDLTHLASFDRLAHQLHDGGYVAVLPRDDDLVLANLCLAYAVVLSSKRPGGAGRVCGWLGWLWRVWVSRTRERERGPPAMARHRSQMETALMAYWHMVPLLMRADAPVSSTTDHSVLALSSCHLLLDTWQSIQGPSTAGDRLTHASRRW